MNSAPTAYIFSSAISLNQMISLVTEIEAEVYASPVYCQTLATLKKNSKNEKSTDSLLKKITRSVIRVAFKRFLAIPELQAESFPIKPFESSNPAPTAPEPVQINPQNHPSITISSTLEDNLQENTEKIHPLSISQKAQNAQPSNAYPKNEPINIFPFLMNQARKIQANSYLSLKLVIDPESKIEPNIDAQKMLHNQRKEQEERLQEIGQQIQAARLAKSITISQLNVKTAILSSKIEAIENGCLDKLPEPIYVQGYIRRLGNAVGLDGDRLANYFLNHPEHTIKAIETNEDKNPETNNNKTRKIYLSSIHLFWLYISLIASALGWLNLLMDQTNVTPENIKENNQNMKCLPVSPETQTTPRQCRQELSPNENNLTANLSISPPEIL